jgi:hypothetical protein
VTPPQVDLAWTDNSAAETGFKVQRSTPPGAFADLTTTAANATSYSDTSAAAGTNYEYQVVATNAVGDATASNVATANVPTPMVTTIAGSRGPPAAAANVDADFVDGNAATARFSSPVGIAVDSGNIYVADTVNDAIRKIDTSGNTTTIANTAGTPGFVDGDAATARFDGPVGIAVDAAGNIYVAEQNNHAIRMIDMGGDTSTIAGSRGPPANAANVVAGFVDGDAATARFNRPFPVAVDSAGNVYVAEFANDAIRRFGP